MNFDYLKQTIKPEPTIVYDNCGVTIGNSEVQIDAIIKTLFIFFLIYLDGKNVNSLGDEENKEVLKLIYGKLQKRYYPKVIDNLCLPQQNDSSTFLKVNSLLNKYLINLLGKQLSEFYVVNNIKDKDYGFYKINLSAEYLDLKLII